MIPCRLNRVPDRRHSSLDAGEQSSVKAQSNYHLAIDCRQSHSISSACYPLSAIDSVGVDLRS